MAWSERDIPDLDGRIALVTGGNGGLGFETARALAQHGARVVLGVRSITRGQEARARLSALAPGATIELLELDLASLRSVRRAAEAMAARHERLDILVANAGLMGIPYGESADGFELQLAVNHLAHAALTGLLLPRLLAAPRARIVTVTSTGRWLGDPIDPDDLSMGPRYDPWRAYGRSKLAALQFAVELNARLRRSGSAARAVCADPGFAHTDLQARAQREGPGLSQRFFAGAVRVVGSPPAVGALPQIRAATDPRARGGALYALRFLVRGDPVRFPPLVRHLGEADRRRMWDLTERLTGVSIEVRAPSPRPGRPPA